MIVLDANILVAAILGRYVPRVLVEAHARGVTLAVPEPQIVEAARVLIEKIELTEADARAGLASITTLVNALGREFFAGMEEDARRRLHERAQEAWPVLAAAMTSGGGVWSNDRDFFGTGVAVWSTRNMGVAT
jgi:predicted nucleic acid-binding protein